MKLVDLVHVALVMVATPPTALAGEQEARLLSFACGAKVRLDVFEEADHEVALKSPRPGHVVTRVLWLALHKNAGPSLLEEVDDLAVSARETDHTPGVATTAADRDSAFALKHSSSPGQVDVRPFRACVQALLQSFNASFRSFRTITTRGLSHLSAANFGVLGWHYPILPQFLAHTVIPASGTTVSDWLQPQISESYEQGSAPLMLPQPQQAIESGIYEAEVVS